MKPFSPRMFVDNVVLYRHVAVTTPQGASTRTFPDPGVSMAASVQKSNVNRVDAQGRPYTEAVHTVRTTENIAAVADDRIVHMDRSGRVHLLAVQGDTEPGGIGDVIWITHCLETR